MTDTDRAATLELLAEMLRLRQRNRELEAENAVLQAAYTRRTQLALAAGLVRFVVTGDAP